MKQVLPRIAATVALAIFAALQAPAATPAEEEIIKIDEDYRVAKLTQDLAALDRILDDAFTETNQNGNSRNKPQSLELWRTFSITALTTDTMKVRFAGETAAVLGTQTENGHERMLFTRVYVKRPTGWHLFASMQFRDPRASTDAPPR